MSEINCLHHCVRGCCEGPTPGAAQAQHYRSVTLATANLVIQNRRDRKLARDLHAYKSLTEDGLEPKRIDGMAELVARDAPAHVIEGRPA